MASWVKTIVFSNGKGLLVLLLTVNFHQNDTPRKNLMSQSINQSYQINKTTNSYLQAKRCDAPGHRLPSNLQRKFFSKLAHIALTGGGAGRSGTGQWGI